MIKVLCQKGGGGGGGVNVLMVLCQTEGVFIKYSRKKAVQTVVHVNFYLSFI
jgi:hypothetical protein